MSTLILALKIMVTLVFVAAAVLKFTGKNAPDWERWGYSRQVMYATGVAEIASMALLWWPGLEFVGTVLMALVLLGALVTLVRHRESASHIAVPALTLAAVLAILFLSYTAGEPSIARAVGIVPAAFLLRDPPGGGPDPGGPRRRPQHDNHAQLAPERHHPGHAERSVAEQVMDSLRIPILKIGNNRIRIMGRKAAPCRARSREDGQ